ncbi:MAG: hypothetical protein JWQ29_3398 [Phenylobacterium sp.]|nr:hypothetical protein [Phenylobacterium sp.]
MDPEPSGVFVLTMQAVAGPENAQPDGRRYTILAFARGESEAAATKAAFQGLEARGWIEGEALRCGEIVDAAAVPEDLRPAMQNARQAGCALIVYDEG